MCRRVLEAGLEWSLAEMPVVRLLRDNGTPVPVSNSIRRWIPFSSTGTSMPWFSVLML